MPLFQRRNPEDAPASGDPAANLADEAELRTHTLTQELLDWLIAALEAVLRTPQLREHSERRASTSLRDALKYADHLYPLTLTKEPDASPTAEGELPPVGEVLGVPGRTAGHDEADQGGSGL